MQQKMKNMEHYIEYIGEYCGSRIYMKRDDKLPFSYGGNKVRIASELFKDIRKGGYTAVISYGSASSNMNRAIADTAKAQGIKCYVIIKKEAAAERENNREKKHDTDAENGDKTDKNIAAAAININTRIKKETESESETALAAMNEEILTAVHETENERLVRAAGAELIYCTDGNVRECVEAVLARARAEGFKPYYIYGDSTGQGNELALMRASYNEYEEIRQYEREKGVKFDAIVLTVGTGMTAAGLTAAINEELMHSTETLEIEHLTEPHKGQAAEHENKQPLVQQADQSGYEIREQANEYSETLISVPLLIGISAARAADIAAAHIKDALLLYFDGDESRIKVQPEVIDKYLCGGYGQYTAEIESAIREMEDKGIPLDPTYTGKSYYGMLKEFEAGNISGNILFIHTGGYPDYMDWKRKK